MSTLITTPFFGIVLSIGVYLIGQWLFKKSHGLFIFQPLFVAMVLGIAILVLLATVLGTSTAKLYTTAYKPGGDLIFWFLSPATIAFAIPLYKRNDIIKKYWLDILASLVIGASISLVAIVGISKLMGLSEVATKSMLPQAATTAIALPIATSIGGNSAVTAMACILNAVIIYALGDWLVKTFRLNRNPIGVGLGLGTSGHTIGSAYTLKLGSVQGSMAAIAVVIIGIVIDLIVPIFSRILF